MSVETLGASGVGINASLRRVCRYLAIVTALGAAYFGAAMLGLSLAFATKQVTAVWPPAGIAVAVLVLAGMRFWPGVYVGALLANIAVAEPFGTAAFVAVGNTIMAVVGAWILRRLAGGRPALTSMRDVLGLVAAAALGPLVSATSGVATLALSGIIPWSSYVAVWRVWWVGDAMGVLLVAPLLLTWVLAPRPQWRFWRILEATVLICALIWVSAAALAADATKIATTGQLKYVVLPPIMWAALRYGPRGSSVATLIVSVVAVVGAENDGGPFASHPPDERFMLLELFLAVAAITGLVLSAGMAERERAQQALEQARARERAETRFHAILESSPYGVITMDGNGMLMSWNPGAAAMFGYEPSAAVGLPLTMLMPARFRQMHTMALERLNRGEPPRLIGSIAEMTGLRSDGSEFPVELSLATWESKTGQSYLGIVRDMSERRAALRRLHELAVIVESAEDAILASTNKGTIKFWNAAAQRIYGYTPEEAIGQPLAMLAADDRKTEVAGLLERLASGERIDHFETVRITKDGRPVDVELTSWPIHSPDGSISGASTIARDISQRKRAEEQFAQLYAQQRHVALTLQRSLMGIPAAIPGVQTASRYLPATQGAGVGGDWFDMVDLGAGKVGCLIGDVMGRGLHAAAVMGQLRSAAHALAKTGLPPQALIQALDAVVTDLPHQIVTSCYVVMDPAEGMIRVCSAGHMPILLVAPDGSVRPLPVPVNVPLGVGGVPYRAVGMAVEPGSTLVLFTDGLVEARDVDIDEQLAALERQLRASFAEGLGLERTADRVLGHLLRGSDGHRDDVTLLLAAFPAHPLPVLDTPKALHRAGAGPSVTGERTPRRQGPSLRR
jgi:PAS domain S-box-containing protein